MVYFKVREQVNYVKNENSSKFQIKILGMRRIGLPGSNYIKINH